MKNCKLWRINNVFSCRELILWLKFFISITLSFQPQGMKPVTFQLLAILPNSFKCQRSISSSFKGTVWFCRIEAGDWLLRGRIQGSVLFRQYYPEGGWGYIVLIAFTLVTILSQGLVLGAGILTKPTIWLYRTSQYQVLLLWVSPLSVSYTVSPLAARFCKNKSSRLCGVLGGLILSLGALFNSFAREYHQVLIRLVIIPSIGI